MTKKVSQTFLVFDDFESFEQYWFKYTLEYPSARICDIFLMIKLEFGERSWGFPGGKES